MDRLKSIIIDDEHNNCENLKNLLTRYCPEVDVVDMAHSAVEGIESINKWQPELVFLDIQMPDGSGFDLLDALKNPSFGVIFVTAYNQYAIKAIRKSAIDYLLKPVNILELKEAVRRTLEQKSRKGEENSQLRNYLENQYSPGKSKKIALPTAERLLFVRISDIIRCKGENNYTHFYLGNGDKVLVSKTLKEFEELLAEDGFLRVHQSHLINIHHVSSYEKTEGGYIRMKDGDSVSISRQRKEMVLDRLRSI